MTSLKNGFSESESSARTSRARPSFCPRALLWLLGSITPTVEKGGSDLGRNSQKLALGGGIWTLDLRSLSQVVYLWAT